MQQTGIVTLVLHILAPARLSVAVTYRADARHLAVWLLIINDFDKHLFVAETKYKIQDGHNCDLKLGSEFIIFEFDSNFNLEGN